MIIYNKNNIFKNIIKIYILNFFSTLISIIYKIYKENKEIIFPQIY